MAPMTAVIEIERAVQQLPPEELAKFREWFAEFDALQWDRQIERDVADGRLDRLAEEAMTDHRDGHSREL